jgi:hypothetical protein
VYSIIRSDLSSALINIKVRPVHWDKEGRVSVVELDSPALKLVLFNIHVVNGIDKSYRYPSIDAVSGS